MPREHVPIRSSATRAFLLENYESILVLGTAIKVKLVTIRLKRAYETAESSDGVRILVDRIWPRGISKDSARIDLWLKDIAPSTLLRKWFGHDPAKWTEFRERYFLELRNNSEAVEQLKQQTSRGLVTFVYGAKDLEHNHALVLKDYLAASKRHS